MAKKKYKIKRTTLNCPFTGSKCTKKKCIKYSVVNKEGFQIMNGDNEFYDKHVYDFFGVGFCWHLDEDTEILEIVPAKKK